MEQIQSLLESVLALMPGANIRQLTAIIQGIYAISSGGVTQLNISRYADISYRGVTRFMGISIEWRKTYIEQLRWYLRGKVGPYILAADETVEDKAGKSTHWVGYFFCSKAKKAIKSVSFSVLSLISVKQRKSYVLDFVQLEQDKAKAAANKAKKAEQKAKKAAIKSSKTDGNVTEATDKEKNKGGRRVGSKTKAKEKTQSVGFKALELLLKRAKHCRNTCSANRPP